MDPRVLLCLEKGHLSQLRVSGPVLWHQCSPGVNPSLDLSWAPEMSSPSSGFSWKALACACANPVGLASLSHALRGAGVGRIQVGPWSVSVRWQQALAFTSRVLL